MPQLSVLVLIGSLLCGVPCASAGPLADSAKRAAHQAAQSQPKRASRKTLLWAGGATMAAGAALVVVSGNRCQGPDCPDPQGELGKVFLGLGLGAVGAAMMITGAFRQIQFGPGTVGYQIRF